MSEHGPEENGTREGAPGPGSDQITRRDFLDGVAITAAGLAIAAAAPHLTGAEAAHAATNPSSGTGLPPDYYPPTATGLTGESDLVVRNTMRIDPPAGSRRTSTRRSRATASTRTARCRTSTTTTTA